MKTIIKGIKEVTRLNGIAYDADKMPILDYQKFTVESDGIIQEVDYKIITSNTISRERGLLSFCFSYPQITICDDDGIQTLSILKETTTDDVKTIIVNKVVEEEEQEFNYDEIIIKYNEEFEAYYNDFMKQYEDNKPMQIMIANWLNGGMSRKEVIKEIRRIRNENIEDNDFNECFFNMARKYLGVNGTLITGKSS